ncbi:F-box only protein 9 [Lasioglossum baleicum]|uniref:F-box only protein 9 n=1 Tax=Lasioglossum baleicum TaxID=434251 RepID=UPI003FCC73EB
MSQTGQSDKSDDDGEDQEGSSLSETNIEDALTTFREQWQQELVLSPKRDSSKASSSKSVEINIDFNEQTIEDKAKNLFLIGIEYEKSRKFYEAIQFYKRAVQLVPDIEFRLYESTKMIPINDNLETLDNDTGSVDKNDENHNDEEDEESDLFFKLCKIVNSNKCVCFPKFEQHTTHISALPMEIVLYILRWVVSSELDMRSLEMFSRVCRGFYISARDSEIWRLACIRAWGVNCGTYAPEYQCWREMYLLRPRLRYNGCYISKTSYIRHGENSFQDRFYRPWQLVEYFRYLRFFPEGKVLMLTSTDEAQACVNAMKSRIPRNPSVLIGHYRLHDNFVTVVLKKQETKSVAVTRKKKREPTHEQTFHIEFEIKDHYKRTNSLLKWLGYTIVTRYGNEHEARMSLKCAIAGRYPPLKFSRVKSYTQESEAPLQ